ncbi:MAG: hypothetical protein KC483_03655 [Nitrosarchaeum sp.]|nr:hypothetical protein [Nitrosarchaeum sp.]
MNTQTILQQKDWQSPPTYVLVEMVLAKEGVKLSGIAGSWENIRGLSWLFVDDWS